MPTLGLVSAPWQHEESLLKREIQYLFSKCIAISKGFPTSKGFPIKMEILPLLWVSHWS